MILATLLSILFTLALAADATSESANVTVANVTAYGSFGGYGGGASQRYKREVSSSTTATPAPTRTPFPRAECEKKCARGNIRGEDRVFCLAHCNVSQEGNGHDRNRNREGSGGYGDGESRAKQCWQRCMSRGRD